MLDTETFSENSADICSIYPWYLPSRCLLTKITLEVLFVLCFSKLRFLRLGSRTSIQFLAALFIIFPKLETTQMSTSSWTDQQNVVYPYNRKYYTIKNKRTTDFQTTDIRSHYAKCKKPATQKYCMIPLI